MELSIIMPAFRAQNTIATSVNSVLLAAKHQQWEKDNGLEIAIIVDDGDDYERVLAQHKIQDARISFFSTDKVGTGSANARNVGLEAAKYRHIAMLDADDLFHPTKLARLSEGLAHSGFVTTGLSIERGGKRLRTVGCFDDIAHLDLHATSSALSDFWRKIPAETYKQVNISMDAMIAYDRQVADPRVDASLNCLTDLDLVLKLLAHFDHALHCAQPIHSYCKQEKSISIGAGASDRYKIRKMELLSQLRAGDFPFADPGAASGMIKFLETSLQAEESFEDALCASPDLIFEDHIEPMLKP